jgi:hypothetical protein
MAQAQIQKIKEALALWKETETKYFDYGVGDTEPNQAFQVIVKRIVKTEAIDWEFFDGGGWSVYSSMAGHKAVCKSLSSRARKIGNKIRSIYNKANFYEQEAIVEYLGGEFWRIDWDYVHHNGRM